MANELFFYGNVTYPVIEKDDKFYADFGEKGLKLLKRNESGKLVKGFPGREPGTPNSATSNANGSHNGNSGNVAPDSGLWAKVRAKVAKNLQIEPANVGITVTNKTVTVNADDVLINPRTKTNVVYALCTWSANLADWLAGNAGTMSPANSVQDAETLAAIHGTAQLLNDWHK